MKPKPKPDAPYPPNRIHEYRMLAGITQEQLAEAAGTSVAQISRLEKRERKLTDIWMARLAPPLRVKPHDLMGSTMNGPGVGESLENQGEVGLVRWWRSLDLGQKAMVTNMMGPPAEIPDPRHLPHRPSPSDMNIQGTSGKIRAKSSRK